MIDELQATKIAVEEVNRVLISGDPLFKLWKQCHVGDAVLVRKITGETSYWLVQVKLGTRVVGFVRILGNGIIEATGVYYAHPEQIKQCPVQAVSMSHEEVSNIVKQQITFKQGELLKAPIFIHDGPRGREVWLVEVIESDKASRWLFVSPAGVYERPAGQKLECGNAE